MKIRLFFIFIVLTMFECYLCDFQTSCPKEVTKHSRNYHVLVQDEKLILKCFFKACVLEFHTYSGLNKHLIKHLVNSNIVTASSSNNDQILSNNSHECSKCVFDIN